MKVRIQTIKHANGKELYVLQGKRFLFWFNLNIEYVNIASSYSKLDTATYILEEFIKGIKEHEARIQGRTIKEVTYSKETKI